MKKVTYQIERSDNLTAQVTISATVGDLKNLADAIQRGVGESWNTAAADILQGVRSAIEQAEAKYEEYERFV